MKGFEDLVKVINESKTIVLASHVMPDGDAIGSLGAMYYFLKEMGKEVFMIIPSRATKFDFMPGINEALEKVPLENYDLLICLDTSREDRLNISKEDISKAKKIAEIDHHRDNLVKSDIKIVDEESPANCQIVYDFLKYASHNISKNIAEYIYLGLMTDTGCFGYERTTAKTYRIAAEMVDLGIDFTRTNKIINDTHSETKMKLLAYLIDNMEVYSDGKIRLAVIDENVINKFKASENDIDSLVNYLRCIEGTIASVYIRYIKDGVYKVSMRTEEPIDASEIASKFNGGGHKRAAGFNTNDLNKTKKELIELLERLFE